MTDLAEWLAANGIVKLPEAVFGQTAAGKYFLPQENITDRDMDCQPLAEMARIQPWSPP